MLRPETLLIVTLCGDSLTAAWPVQNGNFWVARWFFLLVEVQCFTHWSCWCLVWRFCCNRVPPFIVVTLRIRSHCWTTECKVSLLAGFIYTHIYREMYLSVIVCLLSVIFGLVDIRLPWPLYTRLNNFSPPPLPASCCVLFNVDLSVFVFVRKAYALFQLDVLTFEI